MTGGGGGAPHESHKRIAGYEILTKVGQGGMGAVYKARQVSLDRLVALKVLPKQMTESADFVNRFSREARLTGQLNHPNIIKVYDVGRSSTGIWYYAMEYVEGESLRTILEREKRLSPNSVLRILEEMASALENAHKLGIIHRDIKPDNILINQEGRVKLADLGLAKLTEDAALSREATYASMAGTVVGTPFYMAPEQVEGKTVDIRSDLYALGATAYHLLAGEPPFSADSAMAVLAKHVTEPPPPLQEKVPDASPSLVQVIHRLLEKDPGARFQTPAALLAALTPVRREIGHPVRRRPKTLTLPRGAARRNWAVVLGLLLLGGAVAAVAAAQARQRRLRAAPPEPSVPATSADRRAGEEAAEQALKEVDAFRTAHPDDLEGLIARLQAVAQDHPGSRAARQALTQRGEATRLLQDRRGRQQEAEGLRTAVSAMIEGGHLEAASKALAEARASVSPETQPIIEALERRIRETRATGTASPVAETVARAAARLKPADLGLEVLRVVHADLLAVSGGDAAVMAERDALLGACEARIRALEAFDLALKADREHRWTDVVRLASEGASGPLPPSSATRLKALADRAALNLAQGWRGDFETGGLAGWTRDIPFPRPRSRGTAVLALVEGPEAIDGKASLRIGAKELAGPSTGSNGEVQSPEIRLLPGARVALRVRLLCADGSGARPGGEAEAAYAILRDAAGALVPCRPSSPWTGSRKPGYRDAGYLLQRALGGAKVWGTPGAPKRHEARASAPVDLGGRAEITVRICVGLAVDEVEGRNAQLLVDGIEVYYGEDQP